MTKELIGRLGRMLLASPIDDDTTMIAVEPDDLREIRDTLERSNPLQAIGELKVLLPPGACEQEYLDGWVDGQTYLIGNAKGWDAVLAEQEATAAPPPERVQPVGEVELVPGPVWYAQEDEYWTSEVQVVGGHEVVATVHGGSEAEVVARRDAVLAALSNPVDSGERGK